MSVLHSKTKSTIEPWKTPLSDGTKNKVLSYIDKLANVKLLDFGAGYGRYLDLFSEHIKKENLFGAEIDTEGYKKLKESGYNCYQPEYDTPIIPYDNSYFDYIFTSNVLEHIPNNYYLVYIDEFHRVLKTGGKLIFGAPNYPAKRFYDLIKAVRSKNYKYYLFDDPTHCNKLSIYQYEKDFRSVFETVELEPTVVFLENHLNILKKYRFFLRIFGDKIIGYCKK